MIVNFLLFCRTGDQHSSHKGSGIVTQSLTSNVTVQLSLVYPTSLPSVFFVG